MNTEDNRAYVFAMLDANYIFIAINDINCGEDILLDMFTIGDDTYMFYRRTYSKHECADLIAATGMMEGPELYVMVKINTGYGILTPYERVAVVWKPRQKNMLEIALSGKADGPAVALTTVENTYSNILNLILQELHIENTEAVRSEYYESPYNEYRISR